VEKQQKKQKRKADESQLHVKRQEMDKVKVTAANNYERLFFLLRRRLPML